MHTINKQMEIIIVIQRAHMFIMVLQTIHAFLRAQMQHTFTKIYHLFKMQHAHNAFRSV